MNSFNTVEDIVIDPSFRRWILQQDPRARTQWEVYLTVHPEKKDLVEKAKLLLEELPRVHYQMSQQELENLWQQIEKKAVKQVQPTPVLKPKPIPLRWYYLAASVAAAILFVGWWHYPVQKFTTTYQTNFGETQEVTLPDGSLVILNANSSLFLNSEHFDDKLREVWMEGEAFFEVKKQTGEGENFSRFIVHTDDLEVEVLGTQFNVNTRRSGTKVVLTEGQVKLNLLQMNENQPVTMLPGEMVTYTPAKKTVIKEDVNINMHTAWKKQELIFEDTSVQEIIDLLEDNYGIKISLQNKEAGTRHYTGTFKNPDPDIILMALTALFDLEIEYQNNTVLLK